MGHRFWVPLHFLALGALGLGALRLPPPPPTPPLFDSLFPVCSSPFIPTSPLALLLSRALRGSPPPVALGLAALRLLLAPSFFFPLPPPSPLCAFLVSFFPLFPALGDLGLSALLPPAPTAHPPPFFCLCFLLSLVPGALGALGLWRARCVLRLCPLPPRRLLLLRCVWCLVLWCRGLLRAILCGSWRFLVFFGALWCWCCALSQAIRHQVMGPGGIFKDMTA